MVNECNVIIEFLFKLFNFITVNYLWWERIPNIYDSIEVTVVRLPMILKPLLRVVFVRFVVT